MSPSALAVVRYPMAGSLPGCCARGERPRYGGAADQRDEIASSHDEQSCAPIWQVPVGAAEKVAYSPAANVILITFKQWRIQTTPSSPSPPAGRRRQLPWCGFLVPAVALCW